MIKIYFCPCDDEAGGEEGGFAVIFNVGFDFLEVEFALTTNFLQFFPRFAENFELHKSANELPLIPSNDIVALLGAIVVDGSANVVVILTLSGA
jgi:hypothetical protein